ncbi:ABC-2 type transport system permease protein [Methanomicrobium sp. W14]|uniref:ABC transporter permease n=1 Tax=Methanomicrobium sp. W14 TaxID=2817839 RepID=UPI001AE4E038|nr:ABC transporter permease subunit [Methanomicrobium sp. W14]MBP2134530.1 ABC-2 type transport system permease protein [Methanomicrobium sp. W14]
MDFNRVFIVAKKELSDNITGKKFLMLLVLFSLVVGIGAFSGISDYYNVLEEYKSGSSDIYLIPPTPVIVFGSISENIGYYGFGAIIAIALGFNLISGERESGSLKSLLSHPVYRDEIINGKALGGLISLLFAETIVFAIVIALMLISGIVPDLNSSGKIFVIWLLVFLFLAANFSLALMASSVCKSSSTALVVSLVVLFVISYLFPVAGPGILGSVILGDEPKTLYSNDMSSMSASEIQQYSDERQEYMEKEKDLSNLFSVFSMQSVFSDMIRPLTRTSSYLVTLKMEGRDDTYLLDTEPSVFEIFGMIWTKLFALLMFPVIFFGIAYVKFMRLDLR